MDKQYTEKDYAKIGRSIMEGHEEARKYVNLMRPYWKEEGQNLKNLRMALDIPRCHIAKKIRISDSTLHRLESGNPVQRRNLVIGAYRTVIDLILLKRKMAVQSLR